MVEFIGTILYSCAENKANFAKSIAYNLNMYRRNIVHRISLSQSGLELIVGVVFVGIQTSSAGKPAIFKSHETYFEFIELAHTYGLKIAAVILQGTKLPGKNRGIDHIVYNGQGVSIRSVGKDLRDFFLNPEVFNPFEDS